MIDLKSKLKEFADHVTSAIPVLNHAVDYDREGYQRIREQYLHPPEHPNGAKAYKAIFKAAERLGADVEYVNGDTWPEGGMGVTSTRGIQLRRTGNKTGEASTLAHELAHWVAHVNRPRQQPPGRQAEAQAEGAAVLVLAALGVEKPESAFYLANNDITGDQVLDNADVIENTAKVILAAAA